jgi:hypothetical protein
MPIHNTSRFIIALLSMCSLGVAAAETGEADSASFDMSPELYSVDYLYPLKDDRKIKTYNLNAYSLIKGISGDKLSFYGGLTATYANGHITQLEGEFSQGTLREVKYETNGFGIGPGLLLDYQPWRNDRFSAHLFGSGNLVFYNKEFPAGGDRYNFMWRGGLVLRYALDIYHHIGLGYQRMHVSNGQGLGPENPCYDAAGVTLQYTTRLK